MKVIRILLQLVIIGAGGLTLAAHFVHPVQNGVSIIVFLGFLAMLFALTLALKEETETRLSSNHGRSFKPFGVFLFLLGVFGVFLGASYLIGTEPLPNGSGSCRAICGLILLASQLFGETTTRVIACCLWLVCGLFLCSIGYGMMRTKAR
jgi:hypothetical protein